MPRLARIIASLCTLVLFVVLVDSCGGTTSNRSTASNGRPTQVALIRLAAGPDGFPSPITGRRLAAIQASLVFDTLVWRDSTGQMIPWLASSWENTPDGTEWSFHLRDGVRWQDNTPLTADDVAFTYNYMIRGPALAPAGIFGSVFIGNLIDIRATSPDTVVFRFKKPWASFLSGIAGLVSILPQHIWGSVTDPAKFTGAQSVIGSGPYRLESFDRATGTAAFVANDSFFLGHPYVRRIEFVPAPDQLLALQRGDIDAANAGTEDQLPEQALRAFSSSRYGIVTGPSDWNRVLHFNLKRGFPYDDGRFRQAVAYAIDREDLVTRILFGRGIPGNAGGLTPSNPYYAPDLPTYDHDPAKARDLLDSIGIKDVNGDGTRDQPDGQPLKLHLQTNSQFSTKTAELITEYLRQVGIDVAVDALDSTTADSNALRGNYDMALIGYGGVAGDPDLMMRIRLSPNAVALTLKAQGYNNPTANALGLQQLFTADDGPRKAVVQQIEHIVATDVPFIPLYFPTPEEIYQRSVFDAWYFTPGGFHGYTAGVLNKAVFVTGKKSGA